MWYDGQAHRMLGDDTVLVALDASVTIRSQLPIRVLTRGAGAVGCDVWVLEG